MAKKSEVVAKKKDNKNLRPGLKIIYIAVLLLLIYFMTNACNFKFNSFNLIDVPALMILLAIALILKSVPLALLAIVIFGILFYIATFCPAHF